KRRGIGLRLHRVIMTLLRVTSISSRHSWGGLHFQPAVKIPLQGRKLTDPPSTGPAPWLPTSPAVAPGPVRHAAPGRQPADVSTSAWPATKGNRAIGRGPGFGKVRGSPQSGSGHLVTMRRLGGRYEGLLPH